MLAVSFPSHLLRHATDFQTTQTCPLAASCSSVDASQCNKRLFHPLLSNAVVLSQVGGRQQPTQTAFKRTRLHIFVQLWLSANGTPVALLNATQPELNCRNANILNPTSGWNDTDRKMAHNLSSVWQPSAPAFKQNTILGRGTWQLYSKTWVGLCTSFLNCRTFSLIRLPPVA